MKKILFGIVLMLFGLSSFFLAEWKIASGFFGNIAIPLPFIGLAVSIWGLFEKDKKD